MKNTLLIGLATGALLLSLAGAASAYTINYDSASATDGSVLTTANSWATVYTFNSNSDPLPKTFPATISGATYVTGFSSGVYAAPATGKDALHIDLTQYLTIGRGGQSAITFGTTGNYLGLFWGSMDVYNTLELFNGNNLVLSITGSNVTGDANGAQYYSPTNRYVNIYSTDLFNKVVMSSGSNAFEVDNIAFGTNPVPEPAAMLLFGTGIAGLAGIARRKRS